MTTYSVPIIAALCALLTAALPMAQQAVAGESHKHQHEPHATEHGASQEAHVHGVAELLIVLEGNTLDIEFLSPAANLLGFEHEASTAEEQARVAAARKRLADAGTLFHLDPARCRLTNHTADFGSAIGTPDDHNMERTQSDHQRHSNIQAYYRYQCETDNNLTSLITEIPEAFPGIQSLQVQWISNHRQGSATLTQEQRRIVFE